MKEKLLSLSAIKNIDEIYFEFSKMLKTDISLDKAKDLVAIFGNPSEYEILFLGLSSENVLIETKSMNGQFILIPKEGEDVWIGVQKFIFEEPKEIQKE